MSEHYTRSKSTLFSGWYDSEMRAWLVQHGYLKSDTEAKRDEMITLMTNKYKDATSTPYLAWPDARLRAQLRSYGVDDTKYTGRQSLLHEVRSRSNRGRQNLYTDSSIVRYVQSQNKVEQILSTIRETISGGVEFAEEKLAQVLEVSHDESELR